RPVGVRWSVRSRILERTLQRTPTGRLVTMDEVTDAALFLLENRAVNGVNLEVDGGWVMM
ncbi:MAG TPA: SDR family oxidoreductase, partial [Solirubrobacteraceae bacterium]|nr:SDR family oxidoreductase [Solirubrobacteraceae bacterium]